MTTFTKSIFAVELDGKPYAIALPADKMSELLAMAAQLSPDGTLDLMPVPNKALFSLAMRCDTRQELDAARKMQDARTAVSGLYQAVEAYQKACDEAGGDVDGTWRTVEAATHPAYEWLLRDVKDVPARIALIDAAPAN